MRAIHWQCKFKLLPRALWISNAVRSEEDQCLFIPGR